MENSEELEQGLLENFGLGNVVEGKWAMGYLEKAKKWRRGRDLNPR